MSNEKIYLGNGTEKFDGDLVEFSLNLSKMTAEAGEHIFEYNGEKYIKLKVVKKRDGEDQYGKTHYVEVNTFKPQEKGNTTATSSSSSEDLPF
jgi:hypothetical protein